MEALDSPPRWKDMPPGDKQAWPLLDMKEQVAENNACCGVAVEKPQTADAARGSLETPHAAQSRANTHSRIRELREEAAGATTTVAPTNCISAEARSARHDA
jgi:hypothetical protein